MLAGSRRARIDVDLAANIGAFLGDLQVAVAKIGLDGHYRHALIGPTSVDDAPNPQPLTAQDRVVDADHRYRNRVMLQM
jgi:hypothetical protein